jgi:hypothetical protein
MNDIHFEDLMEIIISDSLDLSFIEFYSTVFKQHNESLANERNLAWMLWMMARKINGNEKKVRELLYERRTERYAQRAEESKYQNEEFDKRFAQRLKAMQENGEIMNGKVRAKYKRIIEMLCVGSIHDFESAMKTEFPRFSGQDARR